MMENCSPPLRLAKMSSILGNGCASSCIPALIVFLKSAHIRIAPVGLTQTTIGEAYSTGVIVGSTGSMIPSSSNLCNSLSTAAFNAKGTGRG